MRANKLPTIGFLVLLGASAARADEANEATAEAMQEESDTALAGFEVTGGFDLGYRWNDVDGNENKYFEHLNYRTGPRLFNLNLDITPVGSSFFDLANVYGSGLGGDPFEVFGVTVKKFGGYNLRYRRNTSAYFYRDTLLPLEDSTPALSNAGDFNTFNFDRTNDNFHFDVDATDVFNIYVDFNRQERLSQPGAISTVGEQPIFAGEGPDDRLLPTDPTTVLDIERDEFELDKPLRQLKNDYNVGFLAATRRFSFVYDFGYRQFRSDGRIFLPGLSLGEDPEDETILFFFDQLLPFEYDTPQSTFTANLRPVDRLTINVGFVYANLDGTFDYSERDTGIDFTGSPFDRLTTGEGTLDSTSKLTDIDLIYDVGDSVSLLGGLRFHRYDQETGLSREFRSFVPGGIALEPQITSGVDISSNIFEIGARVFPSSRYQVTGGLRFEKRDVIHFVRQPGPGGGIDPDVQGPNTDRTTFFIDGLVRPNMDWSVLAEYELGDYDNPFTRVSPTRQDRFKLRVRYTPVATPGLSVTGGILLRKLDNDLTDYKLDTNNYNLFVRYDVARITTYGGYTRQDWDAGVVTEVTTAPGFMGGQMFDYPAFYDYKIDMFRGGVGYDITEIVRAGIDLTAYDNAGSFGQDWRQFQIFGDFMAPKGYLIRIAYWRNSYDEADFDFDDYTSNIVTISVGYKF